MFSPFVFFLTDTNGSPRQACQICGEHIATLIASQGQRGSAEGYLYERIGDVKSQRCPRMCCRECFLLNSKIRASTRVVCGSQRTFSSGVGLSQRVVDVLLVGNSSCSAKRNCATAKHNTDNAGHNSRGSHGVSRVKAWVDAESGRTRSTFSGILQRICSSTVNNAFSRHHPEWNVSAISSSELHGRSASQDSTVPSSTAASEGVSNSCVCWGFGS